MRRNICSWTKRRHRSTRPSEARLYRLIEEKLPGTTVVSIGHRSTLEAFHQRNVVLTPNGDRFTLQDRPEDGKPS